MYIVQILCQSEMMHFDFYEKKLGGPIVQQNIWSGFSV